MRFTPAHHLGSCLRTVGGPWRRLAPHPWATTLGACIRTSEAANLLDAVSQLLAHFEPYAEIARIKELRGTVDAVKASLVEEILEAFARVGALAQSVADPESFQDATAGAGDFASLSEACLVVDALGAGAVERQVAAIVADQLKPYTTLSEFQQGGDAASLDQIERRFSWFRRALREVEHRFDKTFPPGWRVAHRMCIDFLRLTREHLEAALGSGDPEAANVTVLLKALQKSLVFEKEMSVRFEGAADEVTSAHEALDEKGNFVDSSSAEGIRRRYEFERAAKERAASGRGGGVALLGSGGGGGGLPTILALMSSVFDPFMGPYIALERKNLEEMMEKYLLEEQVGKDGALPVYTSSVQMFSYIKMSVKRCTALTAGQTFFDLQKEFGASLAQYGAILKQKLGSHAPGKAPEGLEKDVCYVVNTAEYCADTIPQLEELVKFKIDPLYSERVTFQGEQDLFYDVIASAIRTLVGLLEGQVEAAFRTMTAINWGTVEAVGEESAYVRTINGAVLAFIPACRERLSSLYFRNFCDKFGERRDACPLSLIMVVVPVCPFRSSLMPPPAPQQRRPSLRPFLASSSGSDASQKRVRSSSSLTSTTSRK